MNAELTRAVAILSGEAKPPSSERGHVGFVFSPRTGSTFGLPAISAGELEVATSARVTVRGMSALVFGLDVELQFPLGDWGKRYEVIYTVHKDPGHEAPELPANVDDSRLSWLAKTLFITAVQADRTIAVKRRCLLPIEFFRDLNERVRRGQATSYRQWAVDQAIDILRQRRDIRPHETCTVTVDLPFTSPV